GVLLGPSLFGLFFPELQAKLFPPETKGTLYVGAQLGVGLYMFLVGLGFRTEHFKHSAGHAAAVSISGTLAPFAIAVIGTSFLVQLPGLFSPDATCLHATLSMGAAVAITASPMLARITPERGVSDTALGTLSLSAGAIDDATAWCGLAVVLA